jgi:hypothetical protein
MKISIPTRLLAEKFNLQSPDNHEVSYYAGTWEKWFFEDKDFIELIEKHPQQISRLDIVNLVNNVLNGKDTPRKVFLATMLWGYGTRGYGAYRTSLMLNGKNSQNIIEEAFRLVSIGKHGDAYEMFSLPRCGSAFFTKYFYFVGWGSKSTPMPLILDSVVSNSLEKINVNISNLAKVIRNNEGKITSVGRYVDGYLRYIEMISNWATEIGCRPDSIEKWLFEFPQ